MRHGKTIDNTAVTRCATDRVEAENKIFTISRNCSSTRKISIIHIFLYFLFFLCVSHAQSPVFSVHPASTAGVHGSTVNFTCTANVSFLVYFVNGTPGTDGTVRSKGFQQQDSTTVDGVTTRVLSVAVSSLYNNTEIYCTDNIVISNTAILTVQGPLSSVVGLSYSFIDSSTVNISWSPPFTLPGTDITGYNISATSNETTTNYFTSDSYYVLLLTDITDSPCNEISVTVSGYNGLNGENESLAGIYLPSATIDIPVPMHIFINRDLTLSVTFNVSDLCVGQYPDNANFYLVINGSRINSTNSTPLDNFTVNNILRVVEDTVYTLEASFSNLNGTFDNISILTFNTFSIESVAITNTTDGGVCVECVFASFSTDSVCTVELVSNNTVLQYTETFSGSSTDSTTVASGCISDVIPGVYTVRILNGRGKAVDIALLPSDITVTSIVITTSTVVPMSESSIPSPTPSVPSKNGTESSSNNDGTVITVSVTVLAVLVAVSGVGGGTVIIFVYKRKHKQVRVDFKDNKQEKDTNQTSSDSVMSEPYRQDSSTSSSADSESRFLKGVNCKYESIPEQTYAELTMNVDNKPRARVPQQPVDYAAVDHQRTANQQIIAETAFTSENVDPSPEAKHHTSFSPPPVPAKSILQYHS